MTPDYEEKIADVDDTALLVIGFAETDLNVIVVRIDDVKSGEQFAYVRLSKARARTAGEHLLELSQCP